MANIEMKDQHGRLETAVYAKYTWTISNFSKLNCKRLFSETFFACSHPWRILLYPKGYNIANWLSIYLNVGNIASFPDGWSRFAKFRLSVINQINGKLTRTHETANLFNESSVSSGTQWFITSAEFHNPIKGFLLNDTCIVVAEISVENSGRGSHSPTKMFSSSSGKLVDFKGLCKIEKDFVPLLEEVCSTHPTLVDSQRKRKRSQRFIEWSLTVLGRVLHFLKTKKVKDMDEDGCNELRNLWEEVEARFDDLTWLEPHVQSALDMKSYLERAAEVKKLQVDEVDLMEEIKSLKTKMTGVEANLDLTRRKLAKAKEGFVKRELDDELGYGI